MEQARIFSLDFNSPGLRFDGTAWRGGRVQGTRYSRQADGVVGAYKVARPREM